MNWGDFLIYDKVNIGLTNSRDELVGKARLDVYSLDFSREMPNSRLRPMVLICPGGGYSWTSEREGEPVAMRFLAAGIHASVLWYSTAPAEFPDALSEVGAAVKYLRENAVKYHIDSNKIIVAGFSAGGHLAASYGCFWRSDFLCRALGLEYSKAAWLRPNGLILGYPVITSGVKAHHETIENLLGAFPDVSYYEDFVKNRDSAETHDLIENRDSVENHDLIETRDESARIFVKADEKLETAAEITGIAGCRDREQLKAALSLEKKVSEDVPPVFIWHTQPDDIVPVENSLLFVNALQEQGIKYEFHVYPTGGHGVSLAEDFTLSNYGGDSVEEVRNWIDMAIRWIREL